MRNWTNPQRSGEQRSQADQAGPPVETLPAGEAEALRATIRAAEEVVGTRKASATVMVATLAIVAASAALLLGRAAELHASLRGEVAGRFGTASAAPARKRAAVSHSLFASSGRPCCCGPGARPWGAEKWGGSICAARRCLRR